MIYCCGEKKSAAVFSTVNNYKDSKHHTKHLWYYCIIRILHPVANVQQHNAPIIWKCFLLSQAQRPQNQQRMPHW